MWRQFSCGVLGCALLLPASGIDQSPGMPQYRPLHGDYLIYSGSLGEQQAPTRHNRKLSLIVEGVAAREMFDAMAPDEKEVCSSEKGARSRRKEHVWCTFSPKEGYTCYFGFDLRTGKSIGGGIC